MTAGKNFDSPQVLEPIKDSTAFKRTKEVDNVAEGTLPSLSVIRLLHHANSLLVILVMVKRLIEMSLLLTLPALALYSEPVPGRISNKTC